MTDREYLRQWARNHATWERRAIRIVQSTMNGLYRGIPVDQINRQNWEAVIILNIPDSAILDMVMEIWRFAGRLAGQWSIDMVDRMIAKSGAPVGEIQTKNKPLFNAEFNNLLAEYFRTGAGAKHIVTMSETARMYLIRALRAKFGVGDEYSLEQIREIVRTEAGAGFPRWMALRIARTEVTGAANWATLQSAKQGKYKLQKKWLAIDDSRTRTFDRGDAFDHLEMDGQTAGLDGYFEQRGVRVLFPGDPDAKPDAKTSAAFIINCRCALSVIPVRDANGRLVLATATDPVPAESRVLANNRDRQYHGLDLRAYENKIMGLPSERGAIYDVNGNQLYELKGNARSVSTYKIGREPGYPALNGKKGNAAVENNVFTHNHPGFTFASEDGPYAGKTGFHPIEGKFVHIHGRKYYNSFSDSDVEIFGYYGATEMRAVTPDGRVFTLRRNTPVSLGNMADDFIYGNYAWADKSLKTRFKRIQKETWREGMRFFYDTFPGLDNTSKEFADFYIWLNNNLKHISWRKYFDYGKYRAYTYDGPTFKPNAYPWRPSGWKSEWKQTDDLGGPAGEPDVWIDKNLEKTESEWIAWTFKNLT